MRDDIPENIRIPETPLTAASQVVGASLFSWPSAFPCSSGPTTTCIISDMDHTQMSAHSQSSTPTPEPEVRLEQNNQPSGRQVGPTAFFLVWNTLQVAPDIQGEGFTALLPRACSPFPCGPCLPVGLLWPQACAEL